MTLHSATMDPATLAIPADLMPADGRFGCGPSRVPQRALDRLVAAAPDLMGRSHRRPAVKDLVGRLQEGVADLFQLPDGYEVLLVAGGATAFWDAATYRLIERRSTHFVFGEFSGKFASAAASAPWLEDPVLVQAQPGSRPSVVRDGDAQSRADVDALTHNETSTGVMMDIKRTGDALVVVDATSGAGGLYVDLGQCDAYYFSLQKGMAAEGGLAVACLSPAALARIEAINATGRHVPAFLDLGIAVMESRRQQTYNTPAIATLFLAAEQVDWLREQGGLAAIAAESDRKARTVYQWADDRDFASPFVTEVDARSHVVATIDLHGVDADDVNLALQANGIWDTEGYRKLGRNQLRIGLFPAVPMSDVEAYIACVDWVVERLA